MADRTAYDVYTEMAGDFEIAWCEDLDRVLPPMAAGVLTVTGRFLAQLTYRDVLAYRGRPFRRWSPKARGAVLALFPRPCDDQDQDFRLRMAKAFDDIAGDVAAGRAPVPRCTGERHALEIMFDHAPRLLAAPDDELRALGIEIGDGRGAGSFEFPCVEEFWIAFITEGAEHSIPAARSGMHGDSDEEVGDEVEAPPEGWSAPRFWFDPFGLTVARDTGDHPSWVTQALSGNQAVDSEHYAQAARLLDLGAVLDPWGAYVDDYRPHDPSTFPQLLTLPGRRLLRAAADDLVEIGYHEVMDWLDEPYERDAEDCLSGDSFLGMLPAHCDHQNVAWRLAMVRAVANLRDDLDAGRAPLPRCNGEEVALHVLLERASWLLEVVIEDGNVVGEWGLPRREELTPRHVQFEAMREYFFQDEDVLGHYDEALVDIVSDPSHPVGEHMMYGDLRSSEWWWTFGNLRPRDAGRGYPASVITRLRETLPWFAAADVSSSHLQPNAAAERMTLRPDLVSEFEYFVGLAQRRFFDRPCAIAMARSLDRLLALYIDDSRFNVYWSWASGDRAIVADEVLLVDRQFCIEGFTTKWRLNADQADRTARQWALSMVVDCVEKILTRQRQAAHSVDEGFVDRLSWQAQALGKLTTIAVFLRYRRAKLGLTVEQLAEAAVLPTATVTGWEAGVPAVGPTLARCAAALQLPTESLKQAMLGIRPADYWPLPSPSRVRKTQHD